MTVSRIRRSVARGIIAALAASALSLPAPAMAGAAVLISPIDPTIAPDQQSGSLWLENRGDAPVPLQVRVFGWSQPDGEDSYEQQARVVPSPPILTLEPGNRQLIRLIAADTARREGETAYRVLVDELPAPPDGDGDSGNVRFRMRYSIPLFVYGGAASPKQAGEDPQLACSLLHEAETPRVEIRNAGGYHARIVDLSIESGGRTTQIGTGLVGYALAGGGFATALPASAATPARLVMSVDSRAEPIVADCR
jgi:fimbrial chaperone protein